jgi:hypothetical protein
MDPFRRPITLDMTPEGRFTGPGRPAWPVRIGAVAALIAATIVAVVIGALVLWIALWLLAIGAIAGLIAWAAFRFHLWRLRHRLPPSPPGPWSGRF